MFIKLTNGVPEIYTIGQLRRDNPNTSFPKDIPHETLASWDVYPLTVLKKPKYNTLTQTIKQDTPQNVNGAWVVSWVVENLPEEQAASNTREYRNSLLIECDWTQVIDATVDQTAWASYRQQLRDISAQPTFPYLVSWPIKPE